MAIDPVCDMEVDPTLAAVSTEYGGRTYYFCSDECKAEFESNPQLFAPQQAA